jgi:hypothetical protein
MTRLPIQLTVSPLAVAVAWALRAPS